jgi:CcmD family protein
MTCFDVLTLVSAPLPDLAREIGAAHAALAVKAAALAGQIAALASGYVQAAAEGAAAAGATAGDGAAPPNVLRGLRFLSGAYTAVWIILAAYFALLSLRQRRLARQVRRLRERLGA